MGRLKVLITSGLNPSGIDLLKTHPLIDLVIRDQTTAAELDNLIGDYSILVIRSTTQLNRLFLQKAKHLKLVVSATIGTDHIDLQAAQELGIQVINCPTANALSTAEHTLAMLFAVTRHISQSHQLLRNSLWKRSPEMWGVELHGKILGIIGMGTIGRIVSEKAMALGMQVIAHDLKSERELKLSEKFKYLESRYHFASSQEEVFRQCDFLTLHVPKNQANHHLIKKEQLALLRPGSFLVNCARGSLVHEADLLDALKSGHLRGAALDVFESEPPQFQDSTTHELIRHPHVVCSAHLGGSTDEAQEKMAVQAAHGVLNFLNRQEHLRT